MDNKRTISNTITHHEVSTVSKIVLQKFLLKFQKIIIIDFFCQTYFIKEF